MANDITEILEKAPCWTLIPPEDDAMRVRLLAALEPLRERKTDEIREGILKYIEMLKVDDRTDGMSKIYLLNRIIFNAPSSESKCRAVFFGGWIGVPVDREKVDMMWPIGVNAKGHLVIVGMFSGYTGEDYRPLAEFEHFRVTYGKRPKASKTLEDANR